MTVVLRSQSLRVQGLSGLVRELRQVDPAFARELSLAFRTIVKSIRDDAKAAAAGQGGVAAHVAPSIRASGTQKSASVTLGDDTDYPMAMGAEFGSTRFHQFKPWRGNDTGAGYFLYPTIRAHHDEVERGVMGAIGRAVAHAFPD